MVLERSRSFSPQHLLATVRRHRVTLLSLVPTMLHRLLRAPGPGLPRCVRGILLGGAPASEALLEEARAREWPVLPTYGLTEACSQVATAPRPGGGVGDGLMPLPEVHVRVVDGDGVEVGIGDPGAILVRGPILLSGYLLAHGLVPGVDDGGWLDTGDDGWVAGDGRLHVLGRRRGPRHHRR